MICHKFVWTTESAWYCQLLKGHEGKCKPPAKSQSFRAIPKVSRKRH